MPAMAIGTPIARAFGKGVDAGELDAAGAIKGATLKPSELRLDVGRTASTCVVVLVEVGGREVSDRVVDVGTGGGLLRSAMDVV